jgi:hypothetical protein
MRCNHKNPEYKIKQLIPTFEFPIRLLFIKKCLCGRLEARVYQERADGTKWRRKFLNEEAKEKIANLRIEFLGDYKIDTHPELDLAPTYYDGKDHSIRKLSPGDPEVEKWYCQQEIVEALLIIAKYKGISYI